MQIGAQLFTVRDFCKDLDSFSETLKKIADIGYKNVQVSGTCEFEAEWLKNELNKNGLNCVITHTPPAKLTGDIDKVICDHENFGCHHIGFGWQEFKLEAYDDTPKGWIEKYAPVAKKIKESGKLFMYHNHDQEFKKVDGKLIIEHLADSFAPDELGFTLDTFWVTAGGGDPAQWCEKLSGRIPVIHLKDFSYGRKMAVVGEGNINFDRIFKCAEASGTKYMLVEQDDCNGEDPFDCLARSFKYLKSCGF